MPQFSNREILKDYVNAYLELNRKARQPSLITYGEIQQRKLIARKMKNATSTLKSFHKQIYI